MIHLFQTGFPITSGLTFYIHSIVVDNMYICIYASQADDGESWEREKKRNPPQLNRPVNGRREPIIISFSRFKMSSFDLMLVHADCYIIGYLHVRIPYESLWWWEICMGTLLAIRSAVSSRPSRRSVSELVGNDKQQPNVWSECFYLEKKKTPTFVRRKKKY